jgi:3-deoxy-manno-octulosonate cytidylyltransferase (CMP-KDO synthetase)|tara:strand:+ start:558 stop:1292 length:735 start_codon:yes stop_codon:yes gene_type:complete
MKTLTIIPSRLSATRLPGKPLLKINDLSIISHVFKRAQEAKIGEVFVATEDQEIVDDVKKNGGRAILTSKNHKTGSDRIHEALQKINIKGVDLIMNLQGDEPIIDIEDIINLNKKMIKNQSEMGTLAAIIKDLKDLKNENMVKVITNNKLNENQFSEAVTFLRSSISVNNIYHHIGIYCYSAETLERFVKLNQSQNEIRNRLEQLRALDNNIKINVALAKSSPIGVDTQEDFIALKKIMEYKDE